MAQFSYIGKEGVVEVFGLAFRAGEVVNVTDPHAVGKLRHNGQFKIISDDVPVHVEPEDVKEDHSEVDGLREIATGLGIKVDGRWSAKKLQRVIDEAQADE